MAVEYDHGQRLETTMKNANVDEQNIVQKKKYNFFLMKISDLGRKLTEYLIQMYHSNNKVIINTIISRHWEGV